VYTSSASLYYLDLRGLSPFSCPAWHFQNISNIVALGCHSFTGRMMGRLASGGWLRYSNSITFALHQSCPNLRIIFTCSCVCLCSLGCSLTMRVYSLSPHYTVPGLCSFNYFCRFYLFENKAQTSTSKINPEDHTSNQRTFLQHLFTTPFYNTQQCLFFPENSRLALSAPPT
jgi:hypothetical protein